MNQDSHKTQAPMAFECEQLTVNYGNVPVLWDISLKIPQGNLVGIIGPNGAGKTTLIKTALGLLKPLAGHFAFFGCPLSDVRQRIGYVPQKESVDWDFPITVKDLVLMGRYGRLGLFRWPRKSDYAAVENYLKMVGMEMYAERQISQLSGGQQQRVFIARALIQEADLYFMDEPFVGIDLASRRAIIDLLREQRDVGKTIFVVHHELNHVETYFDWVIMLNVRVASVGPTASAFNAETLHATYGKNSALFDEALRLSKNKATGLQ